MSLEKKKRKYCNMKIKDFISDKRLQKIFKISSEVGKKDLIKSSDEIEEIMNDLGYKTLGTGTNRLVFTHPDYKDLVFKVAFDWHGGEANEREYADRDISKYLVYSYLISDNFVFLVQEKVKVLTSDIAKKREDDIRDMLKHLSKKLLLCDCKITNFRNFGLRKDDSMCLLDHGDTIPLASDTEVINPNEDYNVSLRCKRVIDDHDPKHMVACGGKLKYDKATYGLLICEKCGQRIMVSEAAKEFYGDARNGGLSKSKSAISNEMREFDEMYRGVFLEKDSYEKKLEREETYSKEDCTVYGNYMIPNKMLSDKANAMLVYCLTKGSITPKEFLKSKKLDPGKFKISNSADERSETQTIVRKNERKATTMAEPMIKKINGEECRELMGYLVPSRFFTDRVRAIEIETVKRGQVKVKDFLASKGYNPDEYKIKREDRTKPKENSTEEKAPRKPIEYSDLTEEEKEMVKYFQKQLDKNVGKSQFTVDLDGILQYDESKRYPINTQEKVPSDEYYRKKLFRLVTNKSYIKNLGFITTDEPDKYVISNRHNISENTEEEDVNDVVAEIVNEASEAIKAEAEEASIDINDAEDEVIIDTSKDEEEDKADSPEVKNNKAIDYTECTIVGRYYVPNKILDLVIDSDGNVASNSEIKSILKDHNYKPKDYKIKEIPEDDSNVTVEEDTVEYQPVDNDNSQDDDSSFENFCKHMACNIVLEGDNFISQIKEKLNKYGLQGNVTYSQHDACEEFLDSVFGEKFTIHEEDFGSFGDNFAKHLLRFESNDYDEFNKQLAEVSSYGTKCAYSNDVFRYAHYTDISKNSIEIPAMSLFFENAEEYTKYILISDGDSLDIKVNYNISDDDPKFNHFYKVLCDCANIYYLTDGEIDDHDDAKYVNALYTKVLNILRVITVHMISKYVKNPSTPININEGFKASGLNDLMDSFSIKMLFVANAMYNTSINENEAYEDLVGVYGEKTVKELYDKFYEYYHIEPEVEEDGASDDDDDDDVVTESVSNADAESTDNVYDEIITGIDDDDEDEEEEVIVPYEEVEKEETGVECSPGCKVLVELDGGAVVILELEGVQYIVSKSSAIEDGCLICEKLK